MGKIKLRMQRSVTENIGPNLAKGQILANANPGY